MAQTGQRVSLRDGYVPGAPFLIGKILNAFLIDHIEADLDVLERVNDLLEDGVRVYGAEFVERLAKSAEERGTTPRRIIRALAIHPSEDIGMMAFEYLKRHQVRLNRNLGRSFLRLLDVGEGADADLASYVLFDGKFAEELMELGRRDAEARRDETMEFLYGSSHPDEGEDTSSRTDGGSAVKP